MNLISKTLKYPGCPEEEIYFKRLNAGQQLQLAKGQKVKQGLDGNPIVELDLGDQLEKSYMLVQMTLCDAGGRMVYKDMKTLFADDAKRLSHIIDLAREAHRDEDEEPLGKI